MKKLAQKTDKAFNNTKGALNNRFAKAAIISCGALIAIGLAAGQTKADEAKEFALTVATTTAEAALTGKMDGLGSKLVDAGLELAKDYAVSKEKSENYHSTDIGFKLTWNLDGKSILRKPDTINVSVNGFGNDVEFEKIKPSNHEAILNPPNKYLTNKDIAEIDAQVEDLNAQIRGEIPPGSNIPTKKEITKRNLEDSSYKAMSALEEDIMEDKMGIDTDEWAGNCKVAIANPDLITDFLAENGVDVPDYGKEALAKGKIEVFLASVMDEHEAKTGVRQGLDEILDNIPNHSEQIAEEVEQKNIPDSEILSAPDKTVDAAVIQALADKAKG